MTKISLTDNSPLSDDDVARIDAYWRAANYLCVGMIYLLDNPLLRTPLKPRPIVGAGDRARFRPVTTGATTGRYVAGTGLTGNAT